MLDREDLDDTQNVGSNTDENYIRLVMPINNLMTEFSEGSNIGGLMQHMFAQIKTQVENSQMPEINFTLYKIMHLHINFHKLELMEDSAHIKLTERIVKTKAAVNPKNNGQQCVKQTAIAELYHEETGNNIKRILKQQYYEDQYNWNGLEFPLAMQKRGRFEKTTLALQ